MPPRPFTLSPAIIADSIGSGVMCLAAEGLGRSYRLHAERPGAALNLRAERQSNGAIVWAAPARTDLPSGAAHVVAPVADSALIRVDISGPIEQFAGYHDPCAGWSDGHDAICERVCVAMEQGDLLLVINSPGGAAAGVQQAVAKALKVKAQYGRRVTVWANEMEGSAAKWWGMCLADETFLPPAGQTGSIGARGQHDDVSGAMAMAGVKRTYFADPPEKVALAPEFPLSPVGEARGNRDVTIAADAFRDAICASPLGMRAGLTPEYLIALGADMLTGENAVAAGLADGVEDFDAVVARALQLAENPEVRAIDAAAREATKVTGAARAKGERAMSLRAEEKPGKDPDVEPESDRGREIPTKCKACKVENPKGAHFCMGCGESMETEDERSKEEDERKERASEPPPPSSKRPGAHPPAPERMEAPRKMSATASLASILGAKGDSAAALKTAALDLRHVLDTARGVTGKTDAPEVVGSLLALPDALSRGKQARADLAALSRKTEGDERWKLARRLVATGAVKRTKVLADVIDEQSGARRLDASGAPLIRIRSTYAEMPIGTLRTLVMDLEKDAPPKRATPFDPSRAAAEERTREDQRQNPTAPGGPSARRGDPSPAMIEAAKTHPAVIAAHQRSGNTLTLDKIAETHARLFAAGGPP